MPMRPSLLACRSSRPPPLSAANSGGGVLPVVGVSLPVILGFAMLAVDAGRYFNLHTSVQWAADALALAAAAELDRKPDAIVRANRAIDNLVANDQRFGDSAGRIARSTRRFLNGFRRATRRRSSATSTPRPRARRATSRLPSGRSRSRATSPRRRRSPSAARPRRAAARSPASTASPATSRRCSPATPTRAPRRSIFDAAQGPELPAPPDDDQGKGRAVFPGQLRLSPARRTAAARTGAAEPGARPPERLLQACRRRAPHRQHRLDRRGRERPLRHVRRA